MFRAGAVASATLTALLLVAGGYLGIGGTQGQGPAVGSSNGHLKDPASFVTSISPDGPTGILAVGSGIYVEGGNSGTLYHWDGTHGLTIVAHAPAGAEGSPRSYESMAAGTVGGLFTIFLIKAGNVNTGGVPGLWSCVHPTPFSCGVQSGFIPLSSSFCSSQLAGTCNPVGLAFRGGNLFYVDDSNSEEVELLGATGFTSGRVHQTLSLGTPEGIFIDSSGNHWVSAVTSDETVGEVFKNGELVKTVDGGIEGIVLSARNPSSTLHVYVGFVGFTGRPGAVLDVTDGHFLPTFSAAGAFDLVGITPSFYFTDFDNGNIYHTEDLRG